MDWTLSGDWVKLPRLASARIPILGLWLLSWLPTLAAYEGREIPLGRTGLGTGEPVPKPAAWHTPCATGKPGSQTNVHSDSKVSGCAEVSGMMEVSTP